ncbi:MAG: AAA family ATPase [Candidatus Parabeggiatoa sp.]|nr:AAA family ATPase [Candidatus Parabeggiatoa sp.]
MNKSEIFQPEIKITKVSAENFRGFENFELEFQPDLTVLIGENGAGKTTLLDCIANLLMVFERKIRSKRIDLKNIFNPLDIRNGQFDLSSQIEMALNDDIKLDWQLLVTKDSYQKPLRRYNHFKGFDKLVTTLNEKLRSKQAVNIPLVVYYPTSNAPIDFIDFKNGTENLSVDVFNAYHEALNHKKSFNFILFFNWYGWQERIERQTGQNKILDVVHNAIYQLLSDDNNPFNQLSINWLNDPNGEMIIHKNEIPLNINQLSSGEKTLLALVADLARRLAIANPHRDNPLMGNGVVLLDEIDLHLHPRWQRSVIPQLQKTFPNCQFIITSHSALVLSQIKPENVIILKDFKVLQNTQHTLGRDTNSILSDIMGTPDRPIDMQQRIDDCLNLIDEGDFKGAKQLLTALSKIVGPNDPDIVYGNSLVNFMDDE